MSPPAREPAPVLALLRRRDPGALQPLLEHLAAGGLFEPRVSEDASHLTRLPAGSLVLAVGDSRLDDSAEESLVAFLEGGGRLLTLGDTLAAWPGLARRLGWEAGPQTPLSELMLRPRPGHPLTARLDAEIPLRDRLRLAPSAPPGATVLIEVSWHYETQAAAFELQLGSGHLVQIGLGTAGTTLAEPVLHQLVHRALRHLAGPVPAAPLRAGLLGYGAIGREHALGIAATEGLELRAVCDSAVDRRRQAAAEFQVELHHDLASLLTESELELVVVGTPPNSHAEMVVRALEAGKHVVCEKPFALTDAECARMISAAEDHGRLLTVYQSRRWDPDFVAMLGAVRAGQLGEPFYMEAFIGGFSHPCNYWHTHEPISGGTIYDWGSHYFDWLLQLFPQPVVRIAAQQQKRVWHDVSNADQVRVDLVFEGGAQASFLQSDIAAALKPKWYLLGTEAALVGEWRLETVNSRAWTGDLVEERLAPAEAPARVLLQRPGPGGGGREELALPLRVANGFYRNLADHLLGGEPLAVTAAQARRAVAVMEAATRSLAEGGRQLEVSL